MPREAFEKLVAEEFPNAVPEKFHAKIANVAFLVEDEPSQEVRAQEGLGPHETLLGLYHGIPNTARGDWYGVGGALPDTITLYQWPIEDEAAELQHSGILQNTRADYEETMRRVIRETIWHEVAHYFGMDEHEVRAREDERHHQ
ncbi:MAG TPA: metallopeptidase family protein [Candidatus Paceibacterota bacterium]|nr:metallopeptidase family protein [Candidatus Paceibacterota bacterium]